MKENEKIVKEAKKAFFFNEVKESQIELESKN